VTTSGFEPSVVGMSAEFAETYGALFDSAEDRELPPPLVKQWNANTDPLDANTALKPFRI